VHAAYVSSCVCGQSKTGIPQYTKTNINTKTTSTTASENISTIREYKKLLDDGIITQEEFDAKKKQLLGL
jgi:predicted Zn-dependent peptidase